MSHLTDLAPEELRKKFLKCYCQKCGQLNDGFNVIGPERLVPDHGDLSICSKCMRMGEFQVDSEGNYTVRLFTVDEEAQLLLDHEELMQAYKIAGEVVSRVEELKARK